VISTTAGSRVVSLGIALMLTTNTLGAQVCRGTPSTSNVSYSFEQMSVGTSNGGSVAFVGSRFAAAIDGRYRSITADNTGMEGLLHLSGVLGTSRLSICPGIRLGVVHDSWNVRSGLSVTSNTIVTGAGVGLGYEQPIGKDFSIAPFGNVGFGFNAVIYSVTATNATTNVTADTLSGLTADYGVVLQYSRVYAAYAASRAPGSGGKNPSAARYIIGVTFGDRRSRK
jgi:hypothetical protein